MKVFQISIKYFRSWVLSFSVNMETHKLGEAGFSIFLSTDLFLFLASKNSHRPSPISYMAFIQCAPRMTVGLRCGCRICGFRLHEYGTVYTWVDFSGDRFSSSTTDLFLHWRVYHVLFLKIGADWKIFSDLVHTFRLLSVLQKLGDSATSRIIRSN